MELSNSEKLISTKILPQSRTHFVPRQPGSAYTHLAGVIFALVSALPLLLLTTSTLSLVSCSIFSLSMFLLYGASTLYHTFGQTTESFLRLKKMDHLMIYVLIAGTYTPVCLLAIGGTAGSILLAIVWGIAFIGIFQCLFFIHCKKWISSIIYIAMGWCCLLAFPQLIQNTPTGAFVLLLVGGAFYTVGGVIYALKLPIFDGRHPNFGLHEIFHCFCLAGTLCHYLMVIIYLA